MKISYSDTAYKSFTAAVPANLVGQENSVVELVAGTNTIQLYTATGAPPLGFLFQRLEGDTAWNVRLIGKGGTVRAKAGATIAANAYVKAAAGGTVITADSGDKAIGMLIGGVAAATGDVVEVLDGFLTVP